MCWALTKPRNRRKDPSTTSALSHLLPAWGPVGPRGTVISVSAGSPTARERGCEQRQVCWAWADAPWWILLVKILLYSDSTALPRRPRHFTCSCTWARPSWKQAAQLLPFGRARVREALGLFLEPSKLLLSQGFGSGRNVPSRSSLAQPSLHLSFHPGITSAGNHPEPPNLKELPLPPALPVAFYPCPALFFTRDRNTTWHCILSHLFTVHPHQNVSPWRQGLRSPYHSIPRASVRPGPQSVLFKGMNRNRSQISSFLA